MGTLFYVIANQAGFINEPADFVNLSFLVSFDSIAAVLLSYLCVLKRKQC